MLHPILHSEVIHENTVLDLTGVMVKHEVNIY